MEELPKERRRDPRFGERITEALRATLRPGCTVSVIDISAGGALIESPRQLRPGSRVHLRLIGPAGTVKAHARVLRCTVWLLEEEGGVVYRGALQFDEHCETLWAGSARHGNEVPVAWSPQGPADGNCVPEPVAIGPASVREHAK